MMAGTTGVRLAQRTQGVCSAAGGWLGAPPGRAQAWRCLRSGRGHGGTRPAVDALPHGGPFVVARGRGQHPLDEPHPARTGFDAWVVRRQRVGGHALQARGVPVAYVPLEGEGHGFRKAENIVRTLEAELYFYQRVFGLPVAAGAPPVQIANLPA